MLQFESDMQLHRRQQSLLQNNSLTSRTVVPRLYSAPVQNRIGRACLSESRFKCSLIDKEESMQHPFDELTKALSMQLPRREAMRFVVRS
jgi:hypothetical protein